MTYPKLPDELHNLEKSIYDCKNLILIPGLIDMKVHLNGSEVENINYLHKHFLDDVELKIDGKTYKRTP